MNSRRQIDQERFERFWSIKGLQEQAPKLHPCAHRCGSEWQV